MAWNAFMHGSAHADLRNPCQFEAWLGENARLVLHLNSVSAGALLQVLADGGEVFRRSLPNLDGGWQVNNEYNTNLTVNLPAGYHRIEIRNAGADWFHLDWLRLENVLPAKYSPPWEASPAAIGLSGRAETLLYVVHPDAVYPGHATNAPAVPATNAMVLLTQRPAGTHRAVWRDPASGAPRGETSGTTTNGVLALPLPAFSEDLAGRLLPVWELSSPRVTPEQEFEFRLRGEAGSEFLLESSTNLPVWDAFGRGTNHTGEEVLHARSTARDPRRFFRVRSVEPE